ncbi:MAG TPA: carbohydrate kinase family protein [Anaerolineales bacterium]|nr:carbohydrate kinase family protein [Anaerolineales bacterium]HRQ92685.1 carbohydrate kinase family protein [Anaerolineales bacterium]
MAKETKEMKLNILGDLIADIGMRLQKFPVQARDIHRLSYMEVGPGGACNVAIMAARFGVPVGALGEVGDDGFGLVVREGLRREGVDVSQFHVSAEAHTPVAGVIVDEASEPGYLGYPGSLQHRTLLPAWKTAIEQGAAFFADGWAEYPESPALALAGFEAARAAGVTTFFDPGPGNPDIDNSWHLEAIAMSNVVLMNRREALRLTGLEDDEAVVQALQKIGAELILLKRGELGLLAARGDERVQAPGLDVEAKDATGAGDSVAGAMIYGVLHDLPLEKLAALGNATGAAKVQNIGTGHNMPSLQQIATVLQHNGADPAAHLPAH